MTLPEGYQAIWEHHNGYAPGICAQAAQLRTAAKRVLEADMLGVRDIDALNALEEAAGFTQQGQGPR